MSLTTCELTLSALIMGIGVWFWAWYLIDEASKIKGLRQKRWYDMRIKKHKKPEKDHPWRKKQAPKRLEQRDDEA